jgi:hypothetical protein
MPLQGNAAYQTEVFSFPKGSPRFQRLDPLLAIPDVNILSPRGRAIREAGCVTDTTSPCVDASGKAYSDR